MSDTPFVVSVMFSKTVQTAPYENEKAEVSSQFQIAEGADAGTAIEAGMTLVKNQVLAALGLQNDKPAVAAPVAAPVAAEPVKRSPGRPPKEDKKPEEAKPIQQVIPDKGTEDKANPPPVAEDDFDFSDSPRKAAKEITDQELQTACSDAAKVITAGVVKGVFQTKYGAQRVSQIQQNERQAFLDDLKTLAAAKGAQG